jgi:hypothetical protein
MKAELRTQKYRVLPQFGAKDEVFEPRMTSYVNCRTPSVRLPLALQDCQVFLSLVAPQSTRAGKYFIYIGVLYTGGRYTSIS